MKAKEKLEILRKAYEKACEYLSIGHECHENGICTEGKTCADCWAENILKEVIENDKAD